MIRKEARLELIVGTMFGGKSTELIRRVKRYEIVGRSVQVFGPSIDTRYGKDSITSHDKLQRQANYVGSVPELEEKVSPDTKVIGIDEVQFFDSAIIDACENYANQGKIVIVAGLLKDFKDGYFPFKDGKKTMSDLLRAADNTTILTAICDAKNGNGEICGSDATRVQRFIDGHVAPQDSPVVQVGGKEDYAPRCRRHYQFYK
ncbi:MAG: thymidine kinase [Nanoarchaeota archaeon]|nr:thymidine kinase [Nanoarchaeota archaeon]